MHLARCRAVVFPPDERRLRLRHRRGVRVGEGGHHVPPTAAVRSSSCATGENGLVATPDGPGAGAGHFAGRRQARSWPTARRAGEAGRRAPHVGRGRQAARHRLKPCAGLLSSAWSCSTASATSATSSCSSSSSAIRTRASGSRRSESEAGSPARKSSAGSATTLRCLVSEDGRAVRTVHRRAPDRASAPLAMAAVVRVHRRAPSVARLGLRCRGSPPLPVVRPPRDVHGPDAGVAREFRGVS